MANNTDIEVYKKFEKQLDRYTKMLDKKEELISDTTYKDMTLRQRLLESRLNKIAQSTTPKLLYLAMFVISLFVNPALATFITIPVIAMAMLSLAIKLIGNVHIVFTKIIVGLIWLVTAIGALVYIISAITMICTIRGIYG